MASDDIVSPARFERFIILLNPFSSRHARAKRWTAELQRLAGDRPVDVIETVPGGLAANATLWHAHADKLGPRTLLCIAAGDGTANMVINFLLSDKKLANRARRTVILPLWGGNGNDLASTLNGSKHTRRLTNLVRYGCVVPVHPMQCRIIDEHGRTSVYEAAISAGFGATGLMCKRLNDVAHRRSKLMQRRGGLLPQTMATTWRALYTSPTFTIKIAGQPKVMYEQTFYNGPRVARFYRQPVRLLDQCFYVDSWAGKRPFLTPLLGILSAYRRTTIRRSKEYLQQHAEFALTQPTWAQFDGEPLRVAAGSKVEVSLSQQPVYALSAILKPIN